MEIIDPVYGTFWQSPNNHLAGKGHPTRAIRACANNMRMSTSEFIDKARATHGNLYDYSKVDYITYHCKVEIIDPVYGAFWQHPYTHIRGGGHYRRGVEVVASKKRMTLGEFINRAREAHGDLYDYRKVEYVNAVIPVCIIDPDYGEFMQQPHSHLIGYGNLQRAFSGNTSVVDHIIPLSIICNSKQRTTCNKTKSRPLFEFLDSDINKVTMNGMDNLKKNDNIVLNGRAVRARDYRNDYGVIRLLAGEIYDLDISDIIEADKIYLKQGCR